MIEVLGYHKLTAAERSHFEAAEVLPLSADVVARAVATCQVRKLSLGDSLVAATELVFARELLTRNIKEFASIPDLVVSDPLANGDPI